MGKYFLAIYGVFKWMSLGYILQICFIKTLNAKKTKKQPNFALVFIMSNVFVLLFFILLLRIQAKVSGKLGHMLNCCLKLRLA